MADEFKVHLLNSKGIQRAVALGHVFEEALAKIDALLNEGPVSGAGLETQTSPRLRAVIVIKLQEASFFAKRALAEKPENQA